MLWPCLPRRSAKTPVRSLDIRPLSDAARAEYAARWRTIQEQFVDQPEYAVVKAQVLVTAVMKEMFPGVVLAPVLSTGASDSLVLRSAGIPTYGISGMFTDIDDVRAHGRDERIGVVEYYDGVEFAYQFVKALTGGRPPRTSGGQ